MASKVQDRLRAIALRKQGKSYSEIQQVIPVSKGTLSRWCANIVLTKKEAVFLRDRTRILQDRGRSKVAMQKRRERDEWRERVRLKAKIDFKRYKDDPLFTLGVALYWAHGAKRGNYFNFVTADKQMMRSMLLWAERYLPLEPAEYRFRLHGDQSLNVRSAQQFWSRACALPLSQFAPVVQVAQRRKSTKSTEYQGSLRFMVFNSEVMLLVQTWQTELSLYHVGAQ